MLPYFSSRNTTTNGELLNILDFPNRAKQEKPQIKEKSHKKMSMKTSINISTFY